MEREIIDTIVQRTRSLGNRSSWIGDDVAVMRPGKGRLVVKVDMLVETTDVPKGMSYRHAARKAVAMCVSDFASKGVRPESFLISLGLRRGVTQRQVEELAQGFRDGQEEWGVRLVGGDTNESGELVIDCFMFGYARSYVTRDGARPGDELVVTGLFGYPPAGLKIVGGPATASKTFSKTAVESVLNPSPNLELGISLGSYLSSAMDSSDGLARSLHTLASSSGVGFEVDALPIGDGVEKFAEENNLVAEELVLNGGEEYLIVGTVPSSRASLARRAARRAGGELIRIGRATPEKGKVVLASGSSQRTIPDQGWTHLG